jgi:hypothetical protein
MFYGVLVVDTVDRNVNYFLGVTILLIYIVSWWWSFDVSINVVLYPVVVSGVNKIVMIDKIHAEMTIQTGYKTYVTDQYDFLSKPLKFYRQNRVMNCELD